MEEFFQYYMHPLTLIVILLAPFLGIWSHKNKACALSWAGGLLIWAIELIDILTNDNVGHWGGMIGGIIIYYVIFVISWNIESNRITKKWLAERNAEKNAERLKIENGEWEFPKKKFYIECKKAKISPYGNDEYSIKKVKMIASGYYEKVDLPEKYVQLHNSKLQDYYDIGKELHRMELEELDRKNRTPAEANYDSQDYLDYLVGKVAREVRGIDKRCGQLDLMIMNCQADINEYVDILNKLGGMGGVKYSKGESWVPAAIVGTIVGGPAMGALAGISVIDKNVRDMKFQNAMNEFGSYISSEAAKLSVPYKTLLDSARQRKKEYMAEHRASANKICLDNPTSEEIAKSIKLTGLKCEKLENGVISIDVNIRNNLSRPQNGEFVLDGAIIGKVYADDIFVDEAVIALPVAGIPFGKTEYAHGCCLKSVNVNAIYRFEITDYNLFLVEAAENADVADA